MDHQFKRLLNLVRRTGDRLVVTDPNGEDTYVLMGLEAYEKLLDTDTLSPCAGLKDDDFLDDYFDEDEDIEEFDDKPKWEIPDELPLPESDKKIWDVMPSAGDKVETWNPEKLSEEEKKIVEEKFEKPEFAPNSDKKDEEEPGEEQFYLEPIE